jgi:hypothetical protein
MNALRSAKRRTARRRREAGAAMFIVSMTLAVLASLGVYALAAAQSEIRSSGNERQNTQTHYMAEYGVLGAAHEITSSKAQFYLGLMLSNPDTPCVSLPTVPGTASILTRACRRLGSTELGAAWNGATITDAYGGNTTPAYSPGVPPGSFGPTPMHGDFFVELTEPNQAGPPPGYATDLHFCFIQMTVSSYGITQPVLPGNVTGSVGAEGLEAQRARITAGPIQCPR